MLAAVFEVEQVDEEQLDALLEGFASWAAVLIRRHAIPPLYSTRVVYRRERRQTGNERWQPPTETYRRGAGDCEDLAAWRAAELRVYASDPARAIARRTGARRWHAVVLRADGRVEDPAKILFLRERQGA